MAHKPKKLNLLCKWGCEALGPLCVGPLELSSSLDMALFEVNQLSPCTIWDTLCSSWIRKKRRFALRNSLHIYCRCCLFFSPHLQCFWWKIVRRDWFWSLIYGWLVECRHCPPHNQDQWVGKGDAEEVECMASWSSRTSGDEPYLQAELQQGLDASELDEIVSTQVRSSNEIIR